MNKIVKIEDIFENNSYIKRSIFLRLEHYSKYYDKQLLDDLNNIFKKYEFEINDRIYSIYETNGCGYSTKEYSMFIERLYDYLKMITNYPKYSKIIEFFLNINSNYSYEIKYISISQNNNFGKFIITFNDEKDLESFISFCKINFIKYNVILKNDIQNNTIIFNENSIQIYVIKD